MRMIALVLCLLAFAAPSHAAQKTRATAQDVASSMEKKCRAMVGRECPKPPTGVATRASSMCNASAIA
jgi:hypothetical protein